MKPFISFLTLAANNEAEALLANASDGGGVFAILQGDSFFVPYGEYPHKTGLQIVDRTAAETMAANQKGIFRRILGVVAGNSAGFPVYIGHPDLPGSKDTDKRSYGWISEILPEETGVRFPVKWSEPGSELIENAHFKFYSPLWWHKSLGKGRVRPVALKSMGLTNDPNIPVPALANESETQDLKTQDAREEEEPPEGGTTNDHQESPTKNEEPMKPEILAALGLEEGATAEDALAKIVSLKEAAEAAANAEKPEGYDADMKKAEDEKAAAEEKARLAEEEKVAANEKVIALTAHVVDAAISAGKLTPAEKDAKTTELLAANDFAAALQDLGKLPAKVKTESKTGDLGTAKSRLVVAANDESAARRNERAVLVANEYANTNPAFSEGERKRIAWQRAQKKNPEVFGSAKQDSSGSAA